MKKIWVAISLCLLIFATSACKNNIKVDEKLLVEDENLNIHTTTTEQEYVVDDLKEEELDLKEVIYNSMYIAECYIIDSSYYNGEHSYFQITAEIEEVYKGEFREKLITIYVDNGDEISIGEKYLFFLEGSVLKHFPSPTYRIYYDTYIKISSDIDSELIMNGEASSTDILDGEIYSLDSIRTYLLTNDIGVGAPALIMNDKEVLSVDNLFEFYNDADMVGSFAIKEIISEGQYVNLCRCSQISLYKGDELSEYLFLLPIDFKNDREYILFLESIDGELELISNESFFDKTESELFSELDKILEN